MPRWPILHVLVKISYWDLDWDTPLGIKLFQRLSFNGEDTPNEVVLSTRGLFHCTVIHYGAGEHSIWFMQHFFSCMWLFVL